MLRSEIVGYLDGLLEPEHFQDYCPNGLQVEGSHQITKIITGVSLSQALIDHAITAKAQAIIVHHGVFWNKSDYALTGIKYQRVAKLIKNDINLLAYHLPLDNHADLGNNVQLAKLLRINISGQTGPQGLLWYGTLEQAEPLAEFVNRYRSLTGHRPQYFGKESKLIHNIAWCTGGADGMFEDAISLGVDCFITGEIKEPIMNLAAESGVAFVAGGHYVTERYGIMALTSHLQARGIAAEFVELYNPI